MQTKVSTKLQSSEYGAIFRVDISDRKLNLTSIYVFKANRAPETCFHSLVYFYIYKHKSNGSRNGN